MSSGFYGVDSSIKGGGRYSGIRRGLGGHESVPVAASVADASGIHANGVTFNSGDRIGLLVDMDARTMTMLRNGTPIPSLVFHNLPEEVFVATTLWYKGSRMRLLRDGE